MAKILSSQYLCFQDLLQSLPDKKYFYRTRVRSLAMLVTPSLTHSCLVNLIDVTLACEDTSLRLVDIVTDANVYDEDCIGNSLLQIWELRIVHKAKLLFRL